ncbi:MAG: porin family protein [Betaproteobacteria bacterium]|nr:porin family protein [Betaproteobacteria bacterium]MDH4322853.1 porin family protein [Betaproteobacteria bacterium]MDH5210103.1 porin family protein [Betaproteobacteria bacterium]
MDTLEALPILRRMAEGMHPTNGERLADTDACQDVTAVRALHVAIATLEQQQRRRRQAGAAPAKQGTPWTEEDDRKLLSRFDAGDTIPALMALMERTASGVRARLLKYGRLAATLAALALGAVIAPQDARAEPYAALSMLDLTPELAAGYRWRHVEAELAHFGELQYSENLNEITRVQDWTIRGDRLTLRGLLPVNEWLTLTASASMYRVTYKYTDSAGPSHEVKGTSQGYGIGAQFSVGRRAHVHFEMLRIKRANEVDQLPQPGYFDLGDPEQWRIGFAYRF